jgi:tetratricopeptide (TPR) repeat protein
LGGNYLNQAQEKERKGDLKGAIADLDRAVQSEPGDGYVVMRRGDIRQMMGDLGGALADYSRAIELIPNSTPAYLGRAEVKGKTRDTQGALADFNHAISISETPEALGRRARFKLSINDFDGAIADTTRALEVSRGAWTEAYNIRGDAKKAKGDTAGALADYQMTSQNAPLPSGPKTESKGEMSARSVSLANSSKINSNRASDEDIKQKLLGYWQSPRHGYHIASNGIVYMCPRKYATTTDHWDVKGGLFYWDAEPHKIVTLTNEKFVYREIAGRGVSFTLIRGTKQQVDPE